MLTNKKKAFFLDKADQVEKSIWELEFKVAKSAQVREGIRQDRDRNIDVAQRIEAQLKGTKDKKEKEVLSKQLEETLGNVKRFEAQMKMIDDQINGRKASENDPGEQGINDTLASLAELRVMYKDYASKL